MKDREERIEDRDMLVQVRRQALIVQAKGILVGAVLTAIGYFLFV